MSKFKTVCFSIILVCILAGALFAPPPASPLLATFWRIYVPFPNNIIVYKSNPAINYDGIKEDLPYYFQGVSGGGEKECVPEYAGQTRFYIDWDDGPAGSQENLQDIGYYTQSNPNVGMTAMGNGSNFKVYWHNNERLSYTVRIYMDYWKYLDDDPWLPTPYHVIKEKVAEKVVYVGNYDIPAAKTFYFYVSSSQSDSTIKTGTTPPASAINTYGYATALEDSIVTFQANFPFQATGDPLVTTRWPYPYKISDYSGSGNPDSTGSDFANGIRPGSVKFQWRVLRPKGLAQSYQEYPRTSGGDWRTISSKNYNFPGVSIDYKNSSLDSSNPFSASQNEFKYKFYTPFDGPISAFPNQEYNILLDVQYCSYVWQPTGARQMETGAVRAIGYIDPMGIMTTNAAADYPTGWSTAYTTLGTCTYQTLQSNPPLNYYPKSTTYTTTNVNPVTGLPYSLPQSINIQGGSTYFRLKVRDTTPASASISGGPATGTSADPLNSTPVTITVWDNNPYANFTLGRLYYDKYDPGSKKCSKLQDRAYEQPPITNPAGISLIKNIVVTNNSPFPSNQDVTTTTVTRTYFPPTGLSTGPGVDDCASATFNLAVGAAESTTYATRMPDAYAENMPGWGPDASSNNHPMLYMGAVQVDDTDHTAYTGYWVEASSTKSFTIYDNDPPNASITIRTDPVVTYSISANGQDNLWSGVYPKPNSGSQLPELSTQNLRYRNIDVAWSGVPSNAPVSGSSNRPDPWKVALNPAVAPPCRPVRQFYECAHPKPNSDLLCRRPYPRLVVSQRRRGWRSWGHQHRKTCLQVLARLQRFDCFGVHPP